MLVNKSFAGKHTQNDGACEVCRKERETNRHTVLKCDCIHLNLYVGNIRLPKAPGFKVSIKKLNFKAAEVIKGRLECWLQEEYRWDTA